MTVSEILIVGQRTGGPPPLVTGVVAVVVFAALIGAYIWWEQRRQRAFRRFAGKNGLEYKDVRSKGPIFPRGSFLNKQSRRGKRFKNLCQGQIEGLDIALFDMLFEYRVGASPGRIRRYHRATTYVMLAAPGLDVPQFLLRPENPMQKLGVALGGQDIDFPSSPEFSARYRLEGKKEDAVRRLFEGALIDFFTAHHGRTAEAKGDTLLYCRAGRRVPVNDIETFVGEARAVMEMLQS